MSKYIMTREEVINILQNIDPQCQKDCPISRDDCAKQVNRCLVSEALEYAVDFLSADAVEVVRCENCVNSVCIPRNIGEDWFCDIKYNEWGEPWATSPEGFCDCGERKETNE